MDMHQVSSPPQKWVRNWKVTPTTRILVDHYMPLAQIRVMCLRSSKKYHQIHNKKQEKPAGQIITLQETNISPPKGTFEDNMPFPIVGYVSSLESNNISPTLARLP